MVVTTTTVAPPTALVEIIARIAPSQEHLHHPNWAEGAETLQASKECPGGYGGSRASGRPMSQEEARSILPVIYEDEHLACVIKVRTQSPPPICYV